MFLCLTALINFKFLYPDVFVFACSFLGVWLVSIVLSVGYFVKGAQFVAYGDNESKLGRSSE